jgi:hypothetical protein
MTRPAAHKWTFAPRFRWHAFGWRPQPAVQRVREATAEIRKVAKKDPALATAGAVLFLEKVSPALECVDSGGDITRCVVPSRHGVFSLSTPCPAALLCARSSDSAKRVM